MNIFGEMSGAIMWFCLIVAGICFSLYIYTDNKDYNRVSISMVAFGFLAMFFEWAGR